MYWKELYHLIASQLHEEDSTEKEAIAKSVIEELSGKSSLRLFVVNEQVPEVMHQKALSIIQRLQKHVPLQYILGYTYFDGLKIQVNSSTLIPRPETEELVSKAVLSLSNPEMMIDFCTGSGCIAIALAKRFKNAEIIATDLSREALDTAKQNAILNGVEHQIHFLRHDLLADNLTFNRKFDLVISNPPYISKDEAVTMNKKVLNYEPEQALFVTGNDPLVFYKRIITALPDLLKKNGKAWMETSYLRTDELKEVIGLNPVLKFKYHKDLSQKDRFVEIGF